VARAGLDVLVTEANADALAAGRRRITTSLDRALAKGKLDEGEHAAALARLTFTADLTDFSAVDLAIEAVAEIEAVRWRSSPPWTRSWRTDRRSWLRTPPPSRS